MSETTTPSGIFPYIPDDMAAEMEPCPFCGEQPTNFWNTNYGEDTDIPSWVVNCGYCAADGPPAPTHAEAIEIWNKRS